ncbi:MAG: response regulator [Lachnospiraceae bacterium]|nr:response regulator [Lachnospiraceae bacterium]MCM1239614.1 response regulator [Lachnospiraceae bacterium]
MPLIYNIYFEVASAVFLVILYIFMKLQYAVQSEINREFRKLTLLVLSADILDVSTAVTLSYAALLPVWLNLFLNTVYFAADAFVGYQFMYYSRLCVGRQNGNSRMLWINRLLMCAYFVILAANLLNGCIFSMGEAGEYVHGTLYVMVYLVPYYLIACSAFVLLSHFTKFKPWQRISIVLYLVLAFMGPAIQMLFFPDVLLGLFSVTLALMMILFTMETPDYQALVRTIGELQEARKEAERAEQTAREASQAKTEFLANMSHEIRTPINGILGYNEMIMRGTRESATAEYAINVQAAGRTLLSIVNDILDFTDIEKGELTLEQEPYFVLSLLQDILTYAEYNARKKGLELRVDIDEVLPRQLSGDLVRLMQIYNNLISNAVKYTVEGFVEIHIGWEKTGDDTGIVETVIKDSGIGMRKEDVRRISESFSRFDPRRTRNVQGVGLGLSIVTRLLDLMGSSLRIESEYGKGSAFSFRLEQAVIEEAPVGKLDPADTNMLMARYEEGDFTAPSARILAVDDNPMNLDLFRRIMKGTEIRIDTACNGAEALELLEKNFYHMVFMDHMMPVMDGMEALKKIREKGLCRNTSVIALTANAVAGEKQGYLDAGFDGYLAKPIVSKQLKDMVRSRLPGELLAGQRLEGVQNDMPAGGTEERWAERVCRPVGKEERSTGQPADPGLLPRLDGLLDTSLGMEYCCDSEEFYQEMLVSYMENQKYEAIGEAYGKDDWENYRILVHALKSTSLSIGAVSLSEQAKALEMAAKEGNIAHIRDCHGEMMAAYRELLDKLDAVIRKPVENRQSQLPAENRPPEAGGQMAAGSMQSAAQQSHEEERSLPHILIVDDSAMNLQIAEKMLGGGFQVSSVDSGEKALEFLKSQIPDLILLDVHMPEMDGFAVMERIREDDACRAVPVIFLTADDDRDTEIRGFQAGALDFITKPFVADIMIQRVSRILQLDRLQKHLQQEVEKQTHVAEERRKKVERLSLQVMKTLAATIDAKDNYTNGHSARVAEYSREIARRSGRSEQEQEDIYYAGLLHDIGKIGIPEEIINKTSRLTDEEYEVIKSHPVIGGNILKNISELADISIGAKWHHERYDGRGYPDRLRGEDIPEVARIIGVADAYDAMTSKRSYRDVMPQEAVRAEIEKGRGSQFDPYYADIMLAMIDGDTEYRMHEQNGASDDAG